PPSFDGVVHVTVADVSPKVAEPIAGASGTVADGVTVVGGVSVGGGVTVVGGGVTVVGGGVTVVGGGGTVGGGVTAACGPTATPVGLKAPKMKLWSTPVPSMLARPIASSYAFGSELRFTWLQYR